ncbi:MAG: D-amino-acid transaminase [Pseudomonadota bacterium]
MSRIAYVNGDFVPLEDAKVSVLDRGFLFADGIYEVTAVVDGIYFDMGGHLDRLERSCREINLDLPLSRAEIEQLHVDLAERNGLTEGIIYLQVTRGTGERDFPFPEAAKPSLVMFTQDKNLKQNPAAETGVTVISVDDLRWKRRDIKSVALLAQVLAKQAAAEKGAAEAWMVEDGYVTEGGSSTSFIVSKDGTLVTRPLSNAVLPGITRQSVLALVEETGIAFEERLFTLDEAYAAQEAFLTSASTFVLPIIEIDGRKIGDGVPGPVAKRLRTLYLETALDRRPEAAE